jgi:hypothetical protein
MQIRHRGVSLGLLAVLAAACAKEAASSKTDSPPEAAYRQFMVAYVEASEARIRPLIVERAGAEVLWQPRYSPELAKDLAASYRSMDIIRVKGTDKRVTLKSMAVPSSVDVIFDGQVWRVDPAPIIAVRRAAEAEKNRQPSQ